MADEVKVKITEVASASGLQSSASVLITQPDNGGTERLYRAPLSVISITTAQITTIINGIS